MPKFLSAIIILTSFLTSSLPALAQTDLSPKDSLNLSPSAEENLFPIPSEHQTLPNTTNCFDDYHFGSVQADVSPSVLSTVPGVPLTFSGTITNDNPYPIVDGSVYVKIFKKQTSGKDADLNSHQNGPLLVDQFFAQENISLKAQGSEPILFVWNIPRGTASGDYQAATYFVTAKRFNLSGLSFTDDVTGNKTDFSIKSDVTNPPVFFNKNTVTLNQKPHKFAIFPLHFPKEENVTAEAELINPSKQDKTIQLTWKLYQWDGLREENQKDEKTETITLKGSETKKVSYAVSQDTGSVAYLVATAKDGEMKSILDIRFVREGTDEIRLNFPSITSYPLTQGQENSLFSCVHSTNSPVVKDNTLTLTLKTLSGEIIHQYTYNGDVSGEMMGVKESFTPEKTIQDFTLTATLKHNNQNVEEVTQTYSCDKLGENCPKENSSATDKLFGSKENSLWLRLGLFLLGAIILFFIIRRIVMKRSSSAFSFFFALIIASSLLFGLGGVKPVEAKSVTWNDTINKTLFRSGLDSWKLFLRTWQNGLQNPNISILYSASATDVSGNDIPDGANVTVGSQIKFQFTPYDDTNIFWFGTGYFNDSPYGRWIGNAQPTLTKCDQSDFMWKAGIGGIDIFIPLSVNPPTKSFNAGSPNLTDCVTNVISGNVDNIVCKVASAGPIIPSMTFNATYARFWHQWYNNPSSGYYGLPFGCSSTQVMTPSEVMTPSDRIQDFLIPIPAQTINFTFNAITPNNPPSAPIVTGPTEGILNTLYPFNAASTDPEGDPVRYEFNWNNDGATISPMPADGITYVPACSPPLTLTNMSSCQVTSSYSWLSPAGSKTFQVRARDNKGGVSGWTSHTIRMVGPPLVDLKINGSNGPINLTQGQTRNFTWTTTDATSCTASSNDIWSGSKAVPSGSESLVANVSSQSPDHDKLTCTGPGGTSSDSVQVNVACTATTGTWGACQCPEEIKWRTNIGADCRSSQEQGECTASEKNSCRDFNFREVAP